jgi:hypothetical protein
MLAVSSIQTAGRLRCSEPSRMDRPRSLLSRLDSSRSMVQQQGAAAATTNIDQT